MHQWVSSRISAHFNNYDATTHIGTVFPDKLTQLSAILSSPDSDELIRDLAILVSHRGVVFFTDQDITIEQQKELGRRLGKLSGNPESSGLHKHPISEDTPELGAEISVISSLGGIAKPVIQTSTRASRGWHADITFERVPSDYAILKMHTLPKVGGDTLVRAIIYSTLGLPQYGYEAYDRLSPAYQKFLENLTAVHNADVFTDYAHKHGLKIQDPRGSPENTGTDLTAIQFTKRIVELTPDESENILKYLALHISENHDLQVRYRWKLNDVAIWDNRVTLHTATNDYTDLRQGNRVVSLGEKPFLDPNSKSRRVALGLK
ncbi:hypothetical protein BDQ17DRAFT_1353911 [Cyathus striatus]|nr:hypothetical protein BDQ17DRAFT_1353911 [Cyathus striatus]